MNRYHAVAVACILLAVGLASHVGAQDIAGSSDHPAVARFQGSVIRAQTRQDFDAYTVPLGPADRSGKKFKRQEDVEGKVLKTLYKTPAGSTPLAVYRSYENSLRQAGFEILFSCATKQCSQEGSLQNTLGYSGKYLLELGGHSLADDGSYLLTARHARSNTYVVVSASHIWGDPASVFYTVDVIELKPMQTGLVTINARALADDLTKSGHVAVYGIYFDTGKADIKPASTPVLDEIAKLLNSNSSLKLHVIGHTDNVGSLASNMLLSKQRAEAVVNILTSKYRVAPGRLQSGGVGPLSPVATNRTEEGRAKNRRVELVEQ
jgi:outer membrane protein OmpA-like peptidoglycan-associated protein